MRKLTTIAIYCDEAGNNTEQLKDLHLFHKENANAAAVAAKLRMEQRAEAELQFAKDLDLAQQHHTRKMFNRWHNVVRRRKAERKSANDKKLRTFIISIIDPLWRRQAAKGGSEEASYLERKTLLLEFVADEDDYAWRDMDNVIEIPKGRYSHHSCPPARFVDVCSKEWMHFLGKHFCLDLHIKDLKTTFIACIPWNDAFVICLVFPDVKSVICISFVRSRIKNEKALTGLLTENKPEEDEDMEKYLNSKEYRVCYDDYDDDQLFLYGARIHRNIDLHSTLQGGRVLKKNVLPFLTFDEAVELSHRDLSGKVHGGPIITRASYPHTYSLLTQLLY
jgi:hypothetical protein